MYPICVSLWKVVDANFLRAPLLEDYLHDGENYVVFTEQACIESYKGSGLRNVYASLDIVARYPAQVVILHGARHVVALQSQSGYKAPREEFIDREQMRGFREFCEAVRLAESGKPPKGLLKQLHTKKRLASEYFARTLQDAELMRQGVRLLTTSFNPALLKQLRIRSVLSADATEVIMTGILLVAAQLLKTHPDVERIPGSKELPVSFLFRCALGTYLRALRWIAEGGIEQASPARLANDSVDITHVAYATFFDGVLSADQKLNDLYEEACWLLHNIFLTSDPV